MVRFDFTYILNVDFIFVDVRFPIAYETFRV